ncbi:MAG TPA: hypothetical protein VNN08_08375 [Thermoanaerobaculia bacterium]|nr:hypothetical protein [Thermoanaerobaculia bacterium]
MKIITGTVLDGRIVVEGERFNEGEQVTVLRREENETFQVSAYEKRELLQSIAQAKRGEFVDADALLAELDEPN